MTTTSNAASRRTGARAPRIIGSLIGLTGSTVFVWANRGSLPGVWPTLAVTAWLVLTCAAMVALFRRRPVTGTPPQPSRHAGAIYLASCAGMMTLIGGGSAVLTRAGYAGATPALVALAVGLHFIPFAKAFGLPFFTVLGGALSLVGAIGLALALTWTLTAAPAAAVLAGLTMAALITANASRAGS